MSINRINSMRMTGLASGLDVDAMVKKMLTSQQSRLDKAKQQKEAVSWKKDAYKSVITMLNSFQSKHLDILSPTSMRLQSSFRKVTASAPSGMAQYFNVSASPDAGGTSLTVNKISQLASAQKIESAQGLSRPVSLNVKGDKISSVLGQSMTFTVNGESRNVKFENNLSAYQTEGLFDIDKFAKDVNKKLAQEFGTQNGEAKVSLAFGKLEDGTPDLESLSIKAAEGNSVQISGNASVVNAIGFTSGASTYVNMNQSIGSVFGGTGDSVSFSINGQNFKFSSGTSVRDMMSEINKSAAGVNISYSTYTDKFTIESTRTGEGDFLRFSDSDFLKQMLGESSSGVYGNMTAGKNAVLTVNGTEIVRSSNSITMDGITLNLVQETPKDGFYNTEAVTAKGDPAQAVSLVKNFVEEYNTMVDTLTKLLGERRPRSNNAYYMPLTDEQRSGMNDKDIEAWEKQGKQGMLYNDPTLTRMLSSIRTAVLESVETASGEKVSLASIGIKTASFYESNSGKLVIDERALQKAAEENPDAVMQLFTQTSSNGDKKTMGLGQSLSNIFDKNLKVSMNESERGALIQQAGTGGANAAVDKLSMLDKKIAQMDENITKIQDRLYRLETKYYNQFAALETVIAKMNSQSSMLSQLSGGAAQQQ